MYDSPADSITILPYAKTIMIQVTAPLEIAAFIYMIAGIISLDGSRKKSGKNNKNKELKD